MKAFSALFVYSILLSLRTSTTLDTLTPSQSIRDGETLISAGGRLEMGFFSPGWMGLSGLDRYITSWKSAEDPAQGEFSGGLDPRGLPQLVVMKGDKIKVRLGSWNGLHFTGLPWYELNPSGIGQGFKWVDDTKSWELGITTQLDECEMYAHCGAYASCNINKPPVRACLEGFIPKSPKEWNLANWSGGCVRETPLACNDRDGFLIHKNVKLPDTSSSWFDKNMSLKECEELCLKNCTCKAYANLDIRNGGSGCLLWLTDLVDIVVLQVGGQDIYIRQTASVLMNHIEKKRHLHVIIIACNAILLMVMLVLGLLLYVRRKKLTKEGMNIKCQNDYNNDGWDEDMELPIFDLITISNATHNFARYNKLGEGGFGSVYKAWELWIEDKPRELIDESFILDDSCTLFEVLQCIHVGLLCVQQRLEDRPNMSSVVLMLSGDNPLPNPRQPGFFTEKALLGEDYSSRNVITCTVLEARSEGKREEDMVDEEGQDDDGDDGEEVGILMHGNEDVLTFFSFSLIYRI
uniref:Apple domain-containing protein n=1 Tax=Quercus lobata TaxID=97700 RepID=A0A7N2L336_QUELO